MAIVGTQLVVGMKSGGKELTTWRIRKAVARVSAGIGSLEQWQRMYRRMKLAARSYAMPTLYISLTRFAGRQINPNLDDV